MFLSLEAFFKSMKSTPLDSLRTFSVAKRKLSFALRMLDLYFSSESIWLTLLMPCVMSERSWFHDP